MIGHNRFLLELTPDGESTMTTEFDISGLDGVISPLARACYWSVQNVSQLLASCFSEYEDMNRDLYFECMKIVRKCANSLAGDISDIEECTEPAFP